MIRWVIVAFFALHTPVSAQDPAVRAEEAAEALRVASGMLQDASTSAEQVEALTASVIAYEDGLSALRESLRHVTTLKSDVERGLARENERLADLMGVLAALSRAPEAQASLHPEGMLAAARAGMVMATLTPAVEDRANRLREQFAEVKILQELQVSALDTLKVELRNAELARTKLAKAASDKSTAQSHTDQAAMQALLNGAETLAAFAESLAGSSNGQDTGFEQAKGALTPPVQGHLTLAYRDPDARGVKRDGVFVSAEPNALVTAPHMSTVQYAGPFLDMGLLVVLEPQSGYSIILAGLGALFVTDGEVLDKGALVGMMGGEILSADEILIELTRSGAHNRTESLYIEVRNGDETLDPQEWFGFEKD